MVTGVEIKWFSTASVAIVCGSGRLLFDPFVPEPGAEVAVPLESFDGYDPIFITHGHYDHISDLPAICRRNPGARIYGTETPCRTLIRKGVSPDRLNRITPGDTITVGPFAVTAFAGKHAVLEADAGRVAGMLLSPHRCNLPHILHEHFSEPENGETLLYEITAEGKRIVLMGSLNLLPGAPVPAEPDLLILPYNGWKDNLSPARQIIEAIRPKRILPDHWDDTFPPLTVPVDLTPILSLYGDRITLLRQGESFTL